MKQLVLLILIFIGGKQADVCSKRCYPGQGCIPREQEMEKFRRTLDGHTISPDDPAYPNATFMYNRWHRKYPAEIVMVASASDIQKALTFARKYNLHVTVKSSGHDYIGRSTWHGSFQINMSQMKKITVNINSNRNDAGEVTVQSGATFREIYHEVNKYNRVVVGGSALTVTPGGYTQGGGHSPLSRSLGLAVDQVLEIQVVTADSKVMNCAANGSIIQAADGTITKTSDTELFWALLGGGGGTFGVVVSYTYKMHRQPTQIVTAYIIYPLSIDGDDSIGRELFRFYINFIKNLPKEWGGYTLISNKQSKINNRTEVGSMFLLLCHFGEWNSPSRMVINQWKSFHPELRTMMSLRNYSSFWEWIKDFGGSPSSRMYQSNVLVQKNNLNQNLSNFLLTMMTTPESDSYAHHSCTGTHIGGKVSEFQQASTSVNPSLRSGIISLSCDVDMKDPIRDDYFIQKGRELHAGLNQHGTGVYVNEPAADTPNWQTQLWGSKYPTLLTIKKKWDPNNILTCQYCVGSENKVSSPKWPVVGVLG